MNLENIQCSSQITLSPRKRYCGRSSDGYYCQSNNSGGALFRPRPETPLSDSIFVKMALNDRQRNHIGFGLTQTRAKLYGFVPSSGRNHIFIPPWKCRALVGLGFIHTACFVLIEVNTDAIMFSRTQDIAPILASSTISVQPVLNLHVVVVCQPLCIVFR